MALPLLLAKPTLIEFARAIRSVEKLCKTRLFITLFQDCVLILIWQCAIIAKKPMLYGILTLSQIAEREQNELEVEK